MLSSFVLSQAPHDLGSFTTRFIESIVSHGIIEHHCEHNSQP